MINVENCCLLLWLVSGIWGSF